MPLAPPPFIPEAILHAMPIVHAWDDDDPYYILGVADKKLSRALADLSDKAKKAFAVACAEWVVRRFGAVSKDPLPLDYIEASWAGLWDWELQYLWEPDSSAYQGAIRGPLDMAVRTMTNCHSALGMGGGENEAAFLSKLAVHVMPDPSAFLRWQSEAVVRLQKLYPRDDADTSGPPVPREALDPEIPIEKLTPERQAALGRDLLSKLDFSKNEFLAPPEQA